MATSIVEGLFGLTPQMYENQQYNQDLNRGIRMAQLSPGAAAQAGLQASVGQLGRGFAGAMGIQDPQLQRITQQEELLKALTCKTLNHLQMQRNKLMPWVTLNWQ